MPPKNNPRKGDSNKTTTNESGNALPSGGPVHYFPPEFSNAAKEAPKPASKSEIQYLIDLISILGSNLASAMKQLNNHIIPLRVSLSPKVFDGDIYDSAHEILRIDASINSRSELCNFIKDAFREIEASKGLDRANVTGRCAWGKTYVVNYMEAIWGSEGASCQSWDLGGVTLAKMVVSDFNVRELLALLKEKGLGL